MTAAGADLETSAYLRVVLIWLHENDVRKTTATSHLSAQRYGFFSRPYALAGGLNVENVMLLTFRSVISDKKRGCCK
jgi:hypothetical protein